MVFIRMSGFNNELRAYNAKLNSNVATWKANVNSGKINLTPRIRSKNLAPRVIQSVQLNNSQISKARAELQRRNEESARVMKAYYANLESKRNKSRNRKYLPWKKPASRKTRKHRR